MGPFVHTLSTTAVGHDSMEMPSFDWRHICFSKSSTCPSHCCSIFNTFRRICIFHKMSSTVPSLEQAMRRFTRLSLRQTETKSSWRAVAPPSRSVFFYTSRLPGRSSKQALSSQCIYARSFSNTAFRQAPNVPTRNPFTRSGVRIFLRGN
jgi:hypothetical protein